MKKEKSAKNKTIDISVEEGQRYLDKCISVDNNVSIDAILNKTILGDTFTVLDNIPHSCVDLVIVDPPYNLDKDFHGNNFKKMNDDDYEAYIDSWISKVALTMKDNATIYVCCDWQSSGVIERVLKRYFYSELST